MKDKLIAKGVLLEAMELSIPLGILDALVLERQRQLNKWGVQNHEPQYWVGILGEEYGEYCQAVNETVFNNGPDAQAKGGYDNMMAELTQVAAVAISAMDSLMRVKAAADRVQNEPDCPECGRPIYSKGNVILCNWCEYEDEI